MADDTVVETEQKDTGEIEHAKQFGDGDFPRDVQDAIVVAKSQGDLFSVTGIRAFGGQVLKAGVITFQPNSKLILNNFEPEWIAIVTDQLQFVDASKDATLKLSIDWQPQVYNPPAAPSKPPKPPKADITHDGAPGKPATAGLPGKDGDHAPRTPKLYIVCGGVADKQSKPIPAALTLNVIADGYSGGNGSNGGPGGPGGDGADGGDGDFDSGIFGGCKHSASNGGDGAPGGQGGPGGHGGNASSGADIVLVGPKEAWIALSYAAFETKPGIRGQGGYAGPSGPSGVGGARGSHPGTCQGGDSGHTPKTPATPHDKQKDGNDGREGVITKVIDNNVERFFQ